MFNFIDDHLLDDIFSRTEQSRLAYNLQTEEFHNLNENLQTYLNDIKKIDDENHQLQNNIEQIRTNYIKILENHLKCLPEDFRQESHILTEAHIERYKSKSHAKRFINEREELKKRINFVASNEKEQIKRLNTLQKQQSSVEKELKNLNEQLQNLYNYVENEKQTHRQAMDKVDDLQIQLEQICIERSKAEFEIQTLREELKLMHTTKEFLDEEHQTILSTQTEANEYLLSCLNEFISRTRDDFNELNKTQLKQLENEYKQMMMTVEENSLTKATINETMINQQRSIQIECEKLQDEHRSITQELIELNNYNQILSEQFLAMEADLYSIRNEHVQELITKDNELERSKIELQSLNEKLNHLAEYDRNLKFELTLYRGVLEGEYRRKQQQLMNNQHPSRPTTLRTTTIRNHKNSPILTNRNEPEAIVEKSNVHVDETQSPIKNLDDENNIQLDHQESNKSFNQNQEEIIESTGNISQEIHQTSSEISKSSIPIDQSLPSDEQLSPTDDEVSSEIPKFPHLFTLSEGQPISIDFGQSPTTSEGVQIYLITASADETTPISNSVPVLTQMYRPFSADTEDGQKPSNILESSSSIPISTDIEVSPEVEKSSIASTISDDQQDSSEIHPSSSIQLEDKEQSSETYPSLSTILKEIQAISEFSHIDKEVLSEAQKSATSPTNIASVSFDIHQSSSTSQENQQITSDVQQSSTNSSNEQPLFTESINPSIVLDNQQQASTFSQEQSTSSEIEQSFITDENIQEQTSPIAANEYESISHDTTAEEVDEKQELVEPPDDDDDNDIKHDETGNVTTIDSDHNDTRQSADSIELLPMDQHDTNQIDRRESLAFKTPCFSQEEDINQFEYNESTLKQDEIKSEEQINSSDQYEIEENTKDNFVSSPGYYGNLNDSTYLNHERLNKQSLVDVEEVDSTSSRKLEENKSQNINESNLESVMQDLRCVYSELANNEDLVEIDDNFPDNLIDRLEFGDTFIRTLFDDLVRKYIVQPAKEEIRSKTFDWIEFRDILFPILTGRYMKRHIRKLFDLFDINKDSYLSLEEIIELLELLQINNATELAYNIINELDKNQDGKVTVEELIESIQQIDDVKNNILSDDIQYKHWYIHHLTDEATNDIQSISLNSSSKINDDIIEMINNGMILLGRIFKRLGPNIEHKQLDSNKPTLSMKITNEFIHNNIQISNDDLQSFIELYLYKKRHSDCFISWIEFRDLFLPFVDGGMFLKDDIIRWFDIFDEKHQNIIIQEQILHLLRLLQIPNSENILKKMIEISNTYTNNNDNSWTLEELIFALEHVDEITTRILPNNQQILSYDLNWLTKNVF
ncbi:unnamed protein product [Rotaria sordida]|uniref:EF-hand domain-containing protein n=2 Tax=Rotaria sordida TaxID=392033 RepID=A0A814TC07_9BILA|nr:unnamed protein product [Rotaria sordida]CAF1206560.1 unnamed protein product [Rotaria sordida]CAF3908994.1 unnamed protein product [Rotaria sordida]